MVYGDLFNFKQKQNIGHYNRVIGLAVLKPFQAAGFATLFTGSPSTVHNNHFSEMGIELGAAESGKLTLILTIFIFPTSIREIINLYNVNWNKLFS